MAQKWKVLAVTSAAAFMAFLDATIVNIAFPDLERSFPDATRAGLAWVLSAYNVVFAALLVLGGRMADIVGLRRLFLAGLLGFVVASVACGLAPSAEVLVAARVVQAVGAALLVPTSMALLLAEFPVSERATAVGLWAAAAAVSAALGPPLGGALVELSGWRLVFFVNVPVGLAALAYARGRLVERRPAEGAQLPDLAGAAILSAGVGALALAIVQGREWGWASAPILGSFAAFAVLVPIALWRSARHPAPVLDLSLFGLRSFTIANLGTLVFATAFFAIVLGNVLFLTSVWGYSVLTAGLAVAPGPLTGAIVAAPAGRIADRYGQRVLIVPGAVLFSLAAGWYALRVGTTPDYVEEWLPAAVLLGAGIGLAFPALGSAAVASLPAHEFGLGSAVNATFRQVGAVLGVSLFVAIVGTPAPADAPAAFDAGWAFVAAAGLAAALLSLALGRTGVESVDRPAYQLTRLRVRDPKLLRRYGEGALPLVERHGGALVALSLPEAEVVEGEWRPELLAVHRWPSRECFWRFYRSPEYEPWLELRHRAAECKLVIFDGARGLATGARAEGARVGET